jgi:hypothetical protein
MMEFDELLQARRERMLREARARRLAAARSRRRDAAREDREGADSATAPLQRRAGAPAWTTRNA